MSELVEGTVAFGEDEARGGGPGGRVKEEMGCEGVSAEKGRGVGEPTFFTPGGTPLGTPTSGVKRTAQGATPYTDCEWATTRTTKTRILRTTKVGASHTL